MFKEIKFKTMKISNVISGKSNKYKLNMKGGVRWHV